jgi:DHA1 family multidrug resistance protein-like MFS transporter
MLTEVMASVPPPSVNHARRTVIAIALVAGLAELAYSVMNLSAMPVYLKYSMGFGESAVAAIVTAFLLCEGLMKGPFGVLGDRIGRKWLIIAGPGVSIFTALFTLLVQPHQWYLFVLLRVLDGLGAAALWTSALAMIADVIEPERRAQAMSLFNVTYLVGIALGPFMGGAANDLTRLAAHHLGPTGLISPEIDPRQASFYLISALFLLTALVACWRIPNIRPHHKNYATEHEAGFRIQTLSVALKRMPAMLLLALVTFLGVGQIMAIIKLFALAELGLSETEFGALLLVPALVIAAASVPLGTLGDCIGKARAVRVGLGLCAFSMWALIFIQSRFALVLGGSLVGVGFVVAFPAWIALVSTCCEPQLRGAVMGAVGTMQGLGAVVGALLGGYLYEYARIPLPFLPTTHPNHYVPFIGCALLLLVAWFLSLFTIKDPSLPC